MVRTLLLSTALSVLPALGAGASWMDGERLVYDVAWGFVTAGEAELRVQSVSSDPGSLEYLSFAHNNGFFESIYRVADTVSTIVSRKDLLPSQFRRIIHEGGWHNNSTVLLSRTQAYLSDTVFSGTGRERKIKRSSDTSVVLDGDTHTVTSAFYMFRTLDLKPGQSKEFLAVSGKKKYHLKVLAHRYETVEVPAGKFDCIVVEPVLDDDGLFKAKGKLTIWLTRDARRLPVLVKSKISLGSIRVELKKIAAE